MKKLNCPNCGAPVDNSCKCHYCGTQYERNNDNLIRIETFQNPCKVYQSQIMIPMEDVYKIGEERTSKIAIRQLSRNLADAIAPNMEMCVETDPRACAQRITAKVRIVEPKYIF